MKNNEIYTDIERGYLFDDILAGENKYFMEQSAEQEVSKIFIKSDFKKQTKIEIGDVRINNTKEHIFNK